MADLLAIKEKECYQEHSRSGNFQPHQKFCELIFDGIMCWTATEAGELAVQPCPTYLMNSKGYATKKCEDNGEWYVNKHYNRKWTNYSQCWKLIDSETALINVETEIENSTIYEIWVPILKNVQHWGYGISLVALISAIIIFLSIKKLQCARNRLHMHLFASFIMKVFTSLLKDILFVKGVAMQSDVVLMEGELRYIKEHYSWTCKALVSAKNYFILANYMFILMEGIYLHNLMFLTIFSDNSQITIYYLCGWGLPLIFISIWIILRVYFEDNMCWTTSENSYYLMMIQIPIIISIVINFILFITIVRILLTKLNSMYIQRRRVKYRRLARSTLILVPLFGVPYILSIMLSYVSFANATLELVWIFCDQVFGAFQGFFVALVYCLLNSEVHHEVRQKYNSIRDRHQHLQKSRERTISHTQQFPTSVIPLQEEILTASLNSNKANNNHVQRQVTIF